VIHFLHVRMGDEGDPGEMDDVIGTDLGKHLTNCRAIAKVRLEELRETGDCFAGVAMDKAVDAMPLPRQDFSNIMAGESGGSSD